MLIILKTISLHWFDIENKIKKKGRYYYYFVY